MTLQEISDLFNKIIMLNHNYSGDEIEVIVSELEKFDASQLNNKSLWEKILMNHYYNNFGNPKMFYTKDGMDVSSLSHYLLLIKEFLNNETKKEKK